MSLASFLLQPGKYTSCPCGSDNLFHLNDVHFWLGSCRLDLMLSSSANLQATTFCHPPQRQDAGPHDACSGHPTLCCVLWIVSHALALWAQGGLPMTLNAVGHILPTCSPPTFQSTILTSYYPNMHHRRCSPNLWHPSAGLLTHSICFGGLMAML